MKKKIVIIGGGLSGILTGYLLKKQNYSVQIIEANNRLGGRIYTRNINNTKVEMGATWLWKYNSELINLCKELNIELYTQNMEGYALFEAMNANHPQKFELPKNQEISYRISNGTSSLIEKISNKFDDNEILLNEKVTEIIEVNNKVTIITDKAEYSSEYVITTIPPNLLINTVKFTPSLPSNLITVAKNTHTWMKDSIKFAVVFKKPFWKDHKLSGVGFSHVGPFSELYDHSNKNNSSFALMGFINSNLYSIDKKDREEKIIKQLIKFFGDEVKDYISYEEEVWRLAPFTNFIDNSYIMPHQNNGHSLYQKSYLNNKLHISGTETSTSFGGYMEGAVIRAKEIALILKNN